jgi:hypothetical protein
MLIAVTGVHNSLGIEHLHIARRLLTEALRMCPALVHRHPDNPQDHRGGSGSQHLYKRAQSVNFLHDFQLFPGHVGLRFTQEKLIIFMHGQRAAIN